MMIAASRVITMLLFVYHALSTVHLTNRKPSSQMATDAISQKKLVSMDSISETIAAPEEFEIFLSIPTSTSTTTVGEEIVFELTSGEMAHGTIDAIHLHGPNAFVWTGAVESGGTFHLSCSSGVIVGEITFGHDGIKYQIRPKDLSTNLYTVKALPRSIYDRDDSPEDTDPALEIEGGAAKLRQEQIHRSSQGKQGSQGSQQGLVNTLADEPPVGADVNALYSRNILDVMFIFTPQAAASVGGTQSSMEALAALSVQLANDAYANTNLPIRMRSVSVATLADTSYVEKDFSVELNRLRYDHDDFFDAEVNIRTRVGADAVVMFTSDTSYCGLSYMWATEDLAYSVVSTQCPTSVVHEVGHNIGCDHDRFTVHDYDYGHYNLGYCWDTSAKTCSRSVMAYAGCVTAGKRTNCPRASYFSSPLVAQGPLQRTTGIATSDNGRVIREQLPRIVGWRRSKIPGGLITNAQPSSIPVGRCQTVVIKGFRIGTASSTITSVTLNGVPVQKILSQSLDEVEVLAGLSDVPGTGDIVVTTSSGYQTTLSGAFTYEATSGSFLTDFDSSLGTIWTSTGATEWSMLRYCDSLPCSNAPTSGPIVGAGGSGNFLKVQAFEASDDVASLTATFNQDVSSGGCEEAVTSLSLSYHMWGPHNDLCRGSLTVSMLTAGTAAWTTILAATVLQAHQDDPWLPLQYDFPNPTAVTALRITADPYSGQSTCFYWGSVSVDEITVTKTTTCPKDNCDFISAEPTIALSARPSARPTRTPTQRPSSPAPLTQRPSAAVSAAPTLLVPVMEIVKFDCSQSLTGVTAEQFLAQSSNTEKFLNTAAATLDVPADSLCCATVTDTGTGADGRAAVLSATGVSIAYTVEMRLNYLLPAGSNEGTGISDFASSKVDSAKQLLSDSVTAGTFLYALKQVLSPEVVSADLSVAPVTSSSFSMPISQVVEITVSPTMAPTANTGSGSAAAAGFTWGVVAYLVLAAIALSATGSAYMFYKHCWKPDQDKKAIAMEEALRARQAAAAAGRATPAATYDQLVGGTSREEGSEFDELVRVATPVRQESIRGASTGSSGISPRTTPPRATPQNSHSLVADTIIDGYRPALGRQNSLHLRPLSQRSPGPPIASADCVGVELSDVMPSRIANWTSSALPMSTFVQMPQGRRPVSRGSYSSVPTSNHTHELDADGWEVIPADHEAFHPQSIQPPQASVSPGIIPRMPPTVVNGRAAFPALSVQISDPSAPYLARPHKIGSYSANSTPTSVRSTCTAVYGYYNHNGDTDPQSLHRQGATPGTQRSYNPVGRPLRPPTTPAYAPAPNGAPAYARTQAMCGYSSPDLAASSADDADGDGDGCITRTTTVDMYAQPPAAPAQPRRVQQKGAQQSGDEGYGAWLQRMRQPVGPAATESGKYPTIWLGSPSLNYSASTDVGDARTPSLYNRSLGASTDTFDSAISALAPRSVASTATAVSASPRFVSHYHKSKSQQQMRMDAVAEDDVA